MNKWTLEHRRAPEGRRYDPAVDLLGAYVSTAPTFAEALAEAHAALGANSDDGTVLVWIQ